MNVAFSIVFRNITLSIFEEHPKLVWAQSLFRIVAFFLPDDLTAHTYLSNQGMNRFIEGDQKDWEEDRNWKFCIKNVAR